MNFLARQKKLRDHLLTTQAAHRLRPASLLVAAKATRRIKFDRNKSVEADLTFWASFLGRGAETMNVGDLHVDDLLIDVTFLTVEVPEIGSL
jgi:hypothetical protein